MIYYNADPGLLCCIEKCSVYLLFIQVKEEGYSHFSYNCVVINYCVDDLIVNTLLHAKPHCYKK